VGEAIPVRCLKNGLWLSRDKDLPFAIMMAPGGRFGLRTGVQVEIAVPAGERGAQFSQEFFRELELLVGQGRTYRGRIISLEGHIVHWVAAAWSKCTVWPKSIATVCQWGVH